ncbi:MAG: hypothetical protein QME44_10945, partial [Thermodesulfobacteriota bacterium]|nr:hypothetical protein [Thermodesulfobacteriota bacterium]
YPIGRNTLMPHLLNVTNEFVKSQLGGRHSKKLSAVGGQRSPSTLLRAVSLSNGKWTFYEAVWVNV